MEYWLFQLYVIKVIYQIENTSKQQQMQLKMSRTPIALKPSPAASTHQLSYSSIMQQRMKQQLQISKHSELIAQLQQLHATVYEREQMIKQIKQEHLKQILLFEIQLKHQMEITSRYDSQMRKCQTSRNQLKNFYQMKLEIVKKQISEAFQAQILAERERCFEDLRLIKENYCSKIALIGEANREREFQVVQKEEKFSNFEVKLSITQSKLNQKQRLLQLQTSKIIQLEQAHRQQQQKMQQLQKKLSERAQQQQKQSTSSLQKVQQQQKLKQQIYERFKEMKVELEASENKRQEIQKINANLKNQLELALRKYNYVQNQLDKLNRKTHKNQEYDKNPIGPMQSERQTERDREREKMKDRERDSKEIITKLGEEIERIKVENQSLCMTLEQKDERIRELEQRQDKNEGILQKNEQNSQKYKNEIQQLKRSEAQIKQICAKFEDEIRRLKEQIAKREQKISELNDQLQSQADQYTRKLEYFSKKGEETQQTWKTQQKRVQGLYEKIESQYLKEMMAQRKKIDELELTLNQTHELMANEAKQKKLLANQLQQLKKSKKK